MKKLIIFFLFSFYFGFSQIHSITVSKKNNFDFNSNLIVIPLEQFNEYVLGFDDLDLSYKSYYLKIEHQTQNWEDSNINEITYLRGFNNQPIRDYIQSSSTKVPYLHYEIALPEIKIGGNYLIKVSTDRYGRNLVFSKKIMVLDKKVNPFGKIEFSNFPSLRNSHQKIDLGFVYNKGLYFQSKDDFKIKVFQNGQILEQENWPSPIINDFEHKIYFQFFNGENNIEAGNEFRLIDLRSSSQNLINVTSISEENGKNVLSTELNKKESNGVYIQKLDRNQNYLFNNYEFPDQLNMIDYVICRFLLNTNKQDEDIYVVGAFNDFKFEDSNKMDFDASKKLYFKDILLKQGIYNYQFKGKINASLIEGNYSLTENQYEILVYLKEPGTNYDNLVGYTILRTKN
jgi:hypothetical protein